MKPKQIYLSFFSLLIAGIIIWFFFHSSNKNQEGGPCDYSSTYYPAKVIAIQSIDSNTFDLKIEVDWKGIKDTLYYGNLFPSLITKTTMDTAHIALGAVFKYEHRQIVHGSCNPNIFRIVLEKWE
ncbi:MAG: hypothetical protein KA981_08475 [Bacteroidia bacterium]|jgi:hypothetical protein|nr:hypothetical protein [Bacteroidia bacterium]